MPVGIDYSGATFGRITLHERVPGKPGYWRGVCACGNPVIKRLDNLKKPGFHSCGKCPRPAPPTPADVQALQRRVDELEALVKGEVLPKIAGEETSTTDEETALVTLEEPRPRPATPEQDLPPPELKEGQAAIPLCRKIGGNNRYPDTLHFRIVAWTIVDQQDYDRFAGFRWSAQWDDDYRSYIPRRMEHVEGRCVTIYLAREILGLPRNPGYGTDEQADHLDHNPLNNTRANLRIATHAENQANRRRDRDATQRYRGVNANGNGYQARFTHNGSQKYFLPTVPLESEAAFMFNQVVQLLRDNHAQRNEIPDEEMPNPTRQQELSVLVECDLRRLGLLPSQGAVSPRRSPHPIS